MVVDLMKPIVKISGFCTICWEKETTNCQYDDVCNECLPLTRNVKDSKGDSNEYR